MEKLANIHPGEILFYEFLEPLEITAYRLSKDLKIPQTRISEIIKGNRRVTADTALRLSKYFGNSAKFWLGIQDDFDIENQKGNKEAELNEIKHYENITTLPNTMYNYVITSVCVCSMLFCLISCLLFLLNIQFGFHELEGNIQGGIPFGT